MGRMMATMRLNGAKDHTEARKDIESSSFVQMALSRGLEAIDYLVDPSDPDKATLMLTMHGIDQARELATSGKALLSEIRGVECVDACRVMMDPRRLT